MPDNEQGAPSLSIREAHLHTEQHGSAVTSGPSDGAHPLMPTGPHASHLEVELPRVVSCDARRRPLELHRGLGHLPHAAHERLRCADHDRPSLLRHARDALSLQHPRPQGGGSGLGGSGLGGRECSAGAVMRRQGHGRPRAQRRELTSCLEATMSSTNSCSLPMVTFGMHTTWATSPSQASCHLRTNCSLSGRSNTTACGG